MTPRIFERTYLALKREVTSGAFIPGQRLQARTLADKLQTSTSPVTQAMRQLIGEDILHYSNEDGFIIPRITERRLQDLLLWSLRLSVSALAQARENHGDHPSPKLSDSDNVDALETLLVANAKTSGSSELGRAVANTNDRLRSTRQIEAALFTDRATEIRRLANAWMDKNELQHALIEYHDRRLSAVPQLVGLSYQERG